MRHWIIAALVVSFSAWLWSAESRQNRGSGSRSGSGSRNATTRSESRPATQAATRPKVAPWTMGPLPKDEVNLILMGDWGTNRREQKYVAESMAVYVNNQKKQFHAALLMGDNFYSRLRDGTRDMQWQTLYEDMYDAKRLNMPFFVSAGNHDWEDGDVKVELDYSRENPDSRWKYPALWYRLDLPADRPLVTIFMVDTNRPRLKPEEWSEQIAWVDAELSKPRISRWTMICGHHQLFSNGAHGDIGLMQLDWGPILLKHNVDFWVNGHEHVLSHLEIPGWRTSFLTSGAAGQGGNTMRRERGPFSRASYGFAHLNANKERVKVTFLDGMDGRPLHIFNRKPGGEIEILETHGVDRAWKGQRASKEFEGSDRTPQVESSDPIPEPKKEKPKPKAKDDEDPSLSDRALIPKGDKAEGELIKPANGTGQ